MRTMLTFLVLPLTLCAAHFVPPARAGDVPIGQPFVLKVGDMVWVGDLPLGVQFETILADSRCPSDVVCIWEGEASARLALEAAGRERRTVALHTPGSPFGESRIEFEGHVVSLLRVLPYPDTRAPTDPGDYCVELRVEEAEAFVATEFSSWSTLKATFR